MKSTARSGARARRITGAVLAGFALLGGGCGAIIERGLPTGGIDPGTVADAVPRPEPLSRYGNPESYEVNGTRYYPLKSATGFVERGIASWYGRDFHGRRTSSGEPYDMYKMTAAHRILPLPTYVEVTNLENGRRAVVRVNDRGPFHDNRIIDLSYAAARKLGMHDAGTALVEVRAVDSAPGRRRPAVRMAEAPDGRFYLQVGAFRELANAERLRRRLEPVVERMVDIQTVHLGGALLHRVRIGPLASVELADRIVETLNRIGVHEHTVVLN